MAKKRAFLCGINYPGTPHALRGCVNDVTTMSDILTRNFGFTTTEKRMLTDTSATTANILDRLNWLVDGATTGDVLYFHYSGHGSQVVSTNYDTDSEPDGKDEIMVPFDMNWRDKMITDDQLKGIFGRVPAGVNLTVVMDCCHSGSILDQGNQYMPLGSATKVLLDPESPVRSRALPMPADIANRAIGLDLPVKSISSRVLSGVDQTGLLISGCQSEQTSADSYFINKYMGAATYYMTGILKKYNYKITYRKLVEEMNRYLVAYKFTQRPQLDGNPELHQYQFLSQMVVGGTRDLGMMDVPDPDIEVGM